MTTARRFALLIIAALFGYGLAPEPQPAVVAAPVVVGSPPGVEAQLRMGLAALRGKLAATEFELADYRTKAEAKPAADPEPPAAVCTTGNCGPASAGVTYRATTRRGLFRWRR